MTKSLNKKTEYTKSGFTLIETVVALALIVGAVVGPLTLISRGLFNAKTSKNRLVASHLAQEGIEIVRDFRDINALEDSTTTPVAWRGIAPDGGNINQGCMNDNNGIQILAGQWEADVVSCNLVAYTAQPLYFDQSGGANNYLYVRAGNCSGAPCGPSIFRRRITITNASGAPESDPVSGKSIPNADRFQVTSEVFWQEGAVTKNVSISEWIYNWR